MLAQIRSAQADLDQLLAQLSNDAASLLTDSQSQRHLLATLEQSLSSGSVTSAVLIRSQIAGAIAATASLGDQARQSSSQRASTDLATAQARTRAAVLEIGRDIYQRRIFDPYLRFASAEEEEAYRHREEENRRAIVKALAENTPEGDLRAARIIDRQLQDAGTHGADASPQFRSLVDRNSENMSRLEAALGGRPAQRDERAAPQQATSEPPAPATNEQLASVLATFRAVGIDGGIPAHHSGHGLSADNSSPNQGRSART